MSSKFGGERRERRQIDDEFQNLVWRIDYLNAADERRKQFAEWLMSQSRPIPGGKGARYIDAGLLEGMISTSECPIEVDSIDFGRAIWLWSALLSREEAYNLLSKAVELGCAAIADLLFVAPELVPMGEAARAEVTIDNARVNTELPRLIQNAMASPVDQPQPDGDALSWLERFSEAKERELSSIRAAQPVFSAGLDKFLESKRSDLDHVLNTLRDAHSACEEREDAAAGAQAYLDATLKELTELFGRDVAPPQELELPDRLQLVGQARACAKNFNGSDLVFKQWLAAQSNPLPLAAISELPAIKAHALSLVAQSATFVDKVRSFAAPPRPTIEISNWLGSLTSREIEVLLGALGDETWIVPAAILARLGLETKDKAAPQRVATWLINLPDGLVRRNAMRFIDPTSSLIDPAPELRRLVAVEAMRDALAFGPIATLTDPSQGFSDEGLVGKTVSSLISLVSANLHLFANADERAKLLAGTAEQSSGAAEAISFIQTPATMTGHFRRLKERAREGYLSTLLHGDRLNITRTVQMIERINSDDLARDVVADVESDLTAGGRIESQHIAQLKRYLEIARKYLVAAVRANTQAPGQHQSQVSEEFIEIIEQLSTSGDIGSQAWLESEVRLMFAGETPRPTTPTLLGVGEVQSLAWTDQDSLWAQSVIDLKEFRVGRPNLTDVCGSALQWWAFGSPPTARALAQSLYEGRHYRAALDVIEEQPSDRDLDPIRAAIEAAAAIDKVPFDERVQALRARYGRALVDAAEFYKELAAALKRFDLENAEERLELLELELQEVSMRVKREAADLREREEISILLSKLLAASVSGLDESASVEELRQRWADELDQRQGERRHLQQAQLLLNELNRAQPEFATLAPIADTFAKRMEEPDFWLPNEKCENFTEFLSGGTQTLVTFLRAASVLTSDVRRALAAVIKAYIGFVEVQSQALRAAAPGVETDEILERCYAFNDLIERASDPLACVEALRDAGEMAAAPEGMPSVNGRITRNAREAVAVPDLAQSVQDAVTNRAWPELIAIGNLARPTAAEGEIAHLDDIVEYGKVMGALQERSPRDLERDQFETCARALGTPGHPISRALSRSDQMDAMKRLLLAALFIDQTPNRPWTDVSTLSWSNILGVWPGLYRSLNETGKLINLNRLLDGIFSTPLGADIVEKMWEGAAKDSNPTAARTELLRYVYDHRGADAISRLVARHDAPLKSKLDQMLELRTAATVRPDLVAVAEAVGRQVVSSAKSAPFRNFVQNLPSAAQAEEGSLEVKLEGDIILRPQRDPSQRSIRLPFTLIPRGIVPDQIQVQLFPEDDVVFAESSSRLLRLTDELMIADKDFSVAISLGESWGTRLKRSPEAHVRLRFSARSVTGEAHQTDATATFRAMAVPSGSSRRIDNESILDFYPGVGSTPAEGDRFVGRADELEQLHNRLVSARHPSPVLLTGMRRVGKTSLLFAFHKEHRQAGHRGVQSVYLSIGELRAGFMAPEATVAQVVFKAIVRAIGKVNFTASDHNRVLGERLRAVMGPDRNAVRLALESCWDEESFSDSLALLGERLVEWLGDSVNRVVFLIDEAESLTIPYYAGGAKKLELEQLLQGLREVSQSAPQVAIVLSGSNHIVEFAREYKNAFFGSCVRVDLAGITERSEARKLIAPRQVRPFVQFDDAAIDFAIELCAGMPLFMWQLGAAVASQVRTGPAVRADIRAALSTLVSGANDDLPFSVYDMLEPIEHMLKLQGRREEDLMWLLLRRVAMHSSLAAPETQSHFLIDQNLQELDNREAWLRRLNQLVELDILITPRPKQFSFKVPVFAEAYRSSRYQHEYSIRLQRAML